MSESDTPDRSPEATREQLRDVETQLARLRGDSAGLTEQVGGQGDGASDTEDTAAAVTNLEETQAIIATLEARRQTLLDRLDAAR